MCKIGLFVMHSIKRYFRNFATRFISPRVQAFIFSFKYGERPSVGDNSFVHNSVQVLGGKFVSVGSNSVISEDSWLNVNHRSGCGFSIAIGDNCFIGRRNFFSSGSKIVFGSFVLTANDCFFLGSSHVITNPLKPVITSGTTDRCVISIGHNSFIGAGARILGDVTIGHGSVIGAASLVTRHVPPFSIVIGAPGVVKFRYSFLRNEWVDVEEFSTADENALLSEEEYLSKLHSFGPVSMPYIAAGRNMGNC